MRKRVKQFPAAFWVALVGLLGLLGPMTPTAYADQIVLKNGRTIQGRIVRKGHLDYVIAVPYGNLTIPVRQVREIVEEDEADYLRESGRRLVRARDHSKGLEFLRKAHASNPESEPCRHALIQGLVTSSMAALEERSARRAQELLTEATALDADTPDVLRLRSELERYERTRTELESRAEEAVATGDVPRAHQLYGTLIHDFPEEMEPWREPFARLAALMGHVELNDQNFESARTRYHEALCHRPEAIAHLRSPLAYAEVRSVIPLLRSGDFAAAIARLEEARGLLPTNPAILYHLGLALEGDGRLAAAAEVYATLAGPDGRTIDGEAHLTTLRHLAEESMTGRPSPHRQKPTSATRQTLESRNFVIHHRDQELARETAQHLEHHLTRLSGTWFPPGTFRMARKVHVHLYPDRDSFLAGSSAPPWADGLTKAERRYGAVVGQSVHYNTGSPQFLTSELPHELAHVLMAHRVRGTLPVWISEGLATSEEPLFKQRHYDRVVRERARAREIFRLEDLLASSRYPSPELVAIFYAQSNSVTRFLRESLGIERTLAFVRQVVDESPVAALAAHTKYDSVAAFERAWLAWIESR